MKNKRILKLLPTTYTINYFFFINTYYIIIHIYLGFSLTGISMNGSYRYLGA